MLGVIDGRKAEQLKRIFYGLSYKKEAMGKNAKGIVIIRKRIAPYFNMSVLFNLLMRIYEVLYQGYLPWVKLETRDGLFEWEDYFVQPFIEKISCGEIKCLEEVELNIEPLWKITYNTCFQEENLQIACRLFHDFVVLNEKTRSYIMDEYRSLFWNKRVLGVVCRGTDMVRNKLSGHPIQPDLDAVISLAAQKMAECQYDFIYLATEEEDIAEVFERHFPYRVLTNRRHYMGSDFRKLKTRHQECWIEDVILGRDISYYGGGLEYLSSVILLSSCKALIGGNCGASLAALFFNQGLYEYSKIFDLGFYA